MTRKQFPSHKPRQIEFIQQRTKSDCGVACLAMIAGLLYPSAKDIVGRIRGGTYPDDLLEHLEDLGFEYKEVKKFPARGAALVALQWHDENLTGHYVVWDGKRKQFLDPLHGIIEKEDMLDCVTIDHIWLVKKES